MSQIVRKKKGRPSKADLAARAAAESNKSHSNHNRRPTAAEEEEVERDIRRSLRRRSGVRYNLLDYDDEDYLDDDDEFEFEEEKMEDEDDGGGGGRREKKLKFVLKLRNSSDSGRAARSNGCSGDSVVRSRRAGCSRGFESEEEEEDDEEERFVKKRRISDEEDEMDDGYGNNDDEEEREDKRDYHKPDFAYALPDPLSRTPMPEKKQLELILDKLQKKDTYGVYADPVDPDELPDYHDIIKNPMDFSTVRKKLANGSYSIFEQFESDIYLICSNAMKYNTSDTVYHKQARAIKELAQRKFHRVRSYIKQTRIENEGNKKEANSEQKPKPMPIVKKQMRNPLGTQERTQERTQDPVSSDFSYGATLATTEPHNTNNGVQTSTLERQSNCEGLVEDMSSLHVESFEKAEDTQSGKGMSKFGRKSFSGDENHRATYELSNQPVDRSNSIFATFEGEDKQLIPVGLYEEHSYAQSLAHYAATLGPIAWRTASKRIEQALPQGSKFGPGWVLEYEPTPTPVLYVAESSKKHQKISSNMQLGIGGSSLNSKPSFLTGSVQQQNQFVRKLQNPCSVDDREQKKPIIDPKPPQMPSMTPTIQQQNPFGRRLQNAGKVNNKSSDSVENGSILPTCRPATPTGPAMQQHNPFSRNRIDVNASTQKTTNPFVQQQRQFAEPPTTRNNNFLQASGNVNRCVDINQMATSPSFPPKQEQGLSDPLQAMRLSVENAQKQQNQMHNLLTPLHVRPAAWMHANPPAGPAYNNKTQELYHHQPHILQSSECPVPGIRYFQHEHQGKASNEHNRSTVFPQLLQSPPSEQKKEQKRKRDMLPPDLNVAFQSSVDPQQPDLALQL